MDAKIKAKWIKALTSGKYKQGHGTLRDEKDRYCCLGVLCDLYRKERDGQWAPNEGYERDFMGSSQFLPMKVARWAGIKDEAAELPDSSGYESLADANDSGKRFSTIAKIIAKHF